MDAQARQMIESLSGRENDSFLQRAYVALLRRPPDVAGVQSYLLRLNAGISRENIWMELANSHEAKNKSQPLSVLEEKTGMAVDRVRSLHDLLALSGAEFVLQAYQAILGRKADPTGLRAYLGRLDAGIAKPQLLADMRSSAEGIAFNSQLPGLSELDRMVFGSVSFADLLMLHGESFLTSAYMVFFKREPDPGGFARYMTLLKSGFSKTFILNELSTSAEAVERSTNVRGLVAAITLYKKAQRRTLTGWYCRKVLGAESDLPADRARRALTYL